jgi:hypothetical protein
MVKRIIETIGHVEKKETLQSLGYSDLVLESQHPFPGYHGTTVPDKDNPKSLFLLTKTRYTEEFIIRSIKSVKKKHKFEFDGSPARVFFQNTMAHAIRVKDLESYKLVPEILQAFKDEGVAFIPGRKVKPYYGLIRVTKYFLMDPITDCTLQDAEIKSMKYFQVPIKLDWDEFEEMTKHVKRNLDDANWDGALATIYRKAGIEDHIRIYCEKDSSLEKLNEIRKKYVQEIKKVMGK